MCCIVIIILYKGNITYYKTNNTQGYDNIHLNNKRMDVHKGHQLIMTKLSKTYNIICHNIK